MDSRAAVAFNPNMEMVIAGSDGDLVFESIRLACVELRLVSRLEDLDARLARGVGGEGAQSERGDEEEQEDEDRTADLHEISLPLRRRKGGGLPRSPVLDRALADLFRPIDPLPSTATP